MVLLRGIGIAKKGLGLLGKNKTQTIKSVPPSLTKGESSAVKLHKLKMSIKKGSDTAEEAMKFMASVETADDIYNKNKTAK